ncbi:MAG: hypothetical protein P8K76_06460 [Candidatus Binatia bacterium]|nr:hypothetical protein [Candidatus Binatia bacterium]MDG2009403.1 hypothetical protein [Candidatus Binatia bacterium]HAC80989.1 hypothetical protein [Deltaproteobacteria bacterium]
MATAAKRKAGGEAGKPARGSSSDELALLRKEVEGAEAKKTRAINRATKALRVENEELEAHLTHAVKEIGHLRFVLEKVVSLESELRSRDQEIQRLKDEIVRLEAAVASGRPTALAAAAAAGSTGSRGMDALLGRKRAPGS